MTVIESFKTKQGDVLIKTSSEICGFEVFDYFKGNLGQTGVAYEIDQEGFLMEKERLKLDVEK